MKLDEIYQISTQSDQIEKMVKIFPHAYELLEFCSLIEIQCLATNNETINKVFEGIRYYKPDPNNFHAMTLKFFYNIQNILLNSQYL